MTYPDPQVVRLYVCPKCNAPEQGPPQGGQTTCSRCHGAMALPARDATPNAGAVRPVDNDPARLAQLRAQAGRPRVVSPTLQAVLGGTAVQAGREQEAIAIWQSLRARAAAGDVVASEDMTMLTMLLAQLPAIQAQPAMQQALTESAYDSAVLPRHKQEQLGRLVRRAVAVGDRPRALLCASWMTPNASEIEIDSEYRLAVAALSTLDRDPQRVIDALGPGNGAVPVVGSMDVLASVFRANAYDLMGDSGRAMQALAELPDTNLLAEVRSSYPSLHLCAQSGDAYRTAATAQAARRAAAGAGAMGRLVGFILGATGMLLGGVSVIVGNVAGFDNPGSFVNLVVGVGLVVAAVVLVVRAGAKSRRATWLRTNGVPLNARILRAQATNTMINRVPVYRLGLQVAGPRGPFQVSVEKLMREHEVATCLGRELRLWANPNNLSEFLLED